MVPSEARTKPRGVGVEARGLTRAFGQRIALQDVSLSISPGSAFGLLGANGAGKTTFIRLVAGTLLPSRGEVTGSDRGFQLLAELRLGIALLAEVGDASGDRGLLFRGVVGPRSSGPRRGGAECD